MKKNLKKSWLILSSTLVVGSSIAPLFLNFNQLPDHNNLNQNNLANSDLNVLNNKIIDWNDLKNFGKTEEFKNSSSEHVQVEEDTNNDFKSTKKTIESKQLIFQNVVNNKYLDYVKLDFKSQIQIDYAKTNYNKLTSDPSEPIGSEVLEFSVENLNKANQPISKVNKNKAPNDQVSNPVSINKKFKTLIGATIDYPWQYERQILGQITAKTDGFKTEINFQNAANLPLKGEGYIINADGGITYQEGNPSSVNSSDIKITKVNDTSAIEGTQLSNYQMTISKKLTGNLTISLDPSSNNDDMKAENIAIVDNSPKPTGSIFRYDPNSGTWNFTINGTNLTTNPDHYLVSINGYAISSSLLSISGSAQAVNISFKNKIENDDPSKPIDASIWVKGAWETLKANQTTNFSEPINKPENNNLLADTGFDYNDSHKNPAGQGSFKLDSEIKSFTKEVDKSNQVFVTLNQEMNYQIKNDIYDHARYKDEAYSAASFGAENNFIATFPKLNPLFDYLTKSVALASQWDNEFYFGQTAMNALKDVKKDVNILFASNELKEIWLENFYKEVFKKVFEAKQSDTKYKIGPNKKAASELFIFEPANWSVDVSIKNNGVDLTFSYVFFDGTIQSFTYPIKTKLFLNNLDKTQDDYKKWDLYVYEKDKPIDISKIKLTNQNLRYADIYYDLYNNIQGSQSLYNTLFQFKDHQAADESIKILETLFTAQEFHENLARTNPVNLLNPERMISFSTTDEENNQYNSWSDLAKGKLKFNLDLGLDLKNFYLADHRSNKKRYTYQFIGFDTQYDIYYNESHNKNQPNKLINIAGFDQKNVNAVNADWILDNLIVYDNQSGNATQNRKISSSSHFGDNKLLGTNLLKEDFIKIVLAGNKNNIKILNRNTTFGTLDVKITLRDIGDLPSSLKAKTLTSANKTTYKLLEDQKQLTFTFSLKGFQQNYDLQYNFTKANSLDATKLGITDEIDKIKTEIEKNEKNKYTDKLLSFNWYDEAKRDPDFQEKLLKTRLLKEDFYKLLETKIKINEDLGDKGINKFNGTFYGRLSFEGDDTKKNNAIMFNNSPADPIDFAQLNTYDINFSLINLPAEIKIYLNPRFFTNTTDGYNYYEIKELSQYSAKQLVNPRFLIKVLNDFNLIDYNKDTINQSSDALIQTNALSYEALIEAFENGIIKFENIINLNEDGVLKFDLRVNANGGKIESNIKNLSQTTTETIQNQVTFKIALSNLKKTINDFENNDFYTYKLTDVNKILDQNYSYLQQLKISDVVNHLIIYKDTSLEDKKAIEQVLKDQKPLEIPLTKQDFLASLNNSLEGFTNGIKIEPTDFREISAMVTIILKKEILFDNQKTNKIRFKIDNFIGRANLDWKINNQDLININEYNNSNSVKIEDLNEEFILKNMFRFSDYPINKKYLLDNSYLSLEEFQKQQNIDIKLTKDLENKKVNVSIMTSTNNLKNTKSPYSSINFVITNFDQQTFSIWENPIWMPIIWTAITIGSFGLITIGFLIRRKIKEKK